MKFETKLVLRKRNIRALVIEAGAVIVFGSLLGARFGRNYFFLWTLGLGIVLLIVGAAMKKDDSLYVGVTYTDVIVTSQGITIGEDFFPMGQLQYLDFFVEGYDGMTRPMLRMRQNRLTGMGNKVHFETGGKRHAYGFYLEDEVSMLELGFLFREFYQNHLFFRERNKGGRTFLFQRVGSKKELEAAKQEEGYN